MVGIVILDYNNATDTINCIESVVTHTSAGVFKMVVVENGSAPETVSSIKHYVEEQFAGKHVILHDGESREELPLVSLLVSASNDGYARGNNKALKILEKDKSIDTVMILNNDILFVEDVIPQLLTCLKKMPDCGIVSPMLLKKDGVSIDYNCARHDYQTMQFFWEYLFSFKDFFGIISRFEYKKKHLLNTPSLANEDCIEIELPSGSCMLISKEVFKSIGYFDPHTFLYFEENILYRKLLAVGRKNYLVPKVRCIHLGASTSKKASSMFTMKSQMESTAYYLEHYRHQKWMARYVGLMQYLTMLKIWIQGLIRK